jgi:hypothetical protein
LASLVQAGTEDGEWLELDREISSLAAPVMTPAQGGINWSALIRVGYAYSDDDIAIVGGENLLGAEFDDIDIAASGQVADYTWRISGDFDFGDLTLEDAYVTWQCGEYFSFLFGNHKASSLRSAGLSPENLLFQNRTAIGSVFDSWDNGIKAYGSFEDVFKYYASVTNGANGSASDQRYSVRWNTSSVRAPAVRKARSERAMNSPARSAPSTPTPTTSAAPTAMTSSWASTSGHDGPDRLRR